MFDIRRVRAVDEAGSDGSFAMRLKAFSFER